MIYRIRIISIRNVCLNFFVLLTPIASIGNAVALLVGD